ncbi:unnamed protein product [Closterium sp. NIES-54]
MRAGRCNPFDRMLFFTTWFLLAGDTFFADRNLPFPLPPSPFPLPPSPFPLPLASPLPFPPSIPLPLSPPFSAARWCQHKRIKITPPPLHVSFPLPLSSPLSLPPHPSPSPSPLTLLLRSTMVSQIIQHQRIETTSSPLRLFSHHHPPHPFLALLPFFSPSLFPPSPPQNHGVSTHSARADRNHCC